MENANNIKMDRILLKMSGEALAGDKKHGFDETVNSKGCIKSGKADR